jgi:hypothetical protein
LLLRRITGKASDTQFRAGLLSFSGFTTMSRREQLEAMLADDPTDHFLRYGLALELEAAGEHERSLELLTGLQHELYVPAFFMAGQQLTKLDRIDEARSVLRQGIATADQVGDTHAAGEMREFLTSLGQLG